MRRHAHAEHRRKRNTVSWRKKNTVTERRRNTDTNNNNMKNPHKKMVLKEQKLRYQMS